MAEIACVGNLERLGFRGRDESKSVGMHLDRTEGLFDRGHVAGDAQTARAVGLVMCMSLDARRERPSLRVRAVANQAERVSARAATRRCRFHAGRDMKSR